jgi:hypothetical protein
MITPAMPVLPAISLPVPDRLQHQMRAVESLCLMGRVARK